MNKQERVKKFEALWSKFKNHKVLKAPFDSGKNLITIARLSKKHAEVVPFVVNSSKMVLFYN